MLENTLGDVDPFLLLKGSIDEWKSTIRGLEAFDCI
jgi:hypothetical protein